MNLKNLMMWGVIVLLVVGLFQLFQNPKKNVVFENFHSGWSFLGLFSALRQSERCSACLWRYGTEGVVKTQNFQNPLKEVFFGVIESSIFLNNCYFRPGIFQSFNNQFLILVFCKYKT